MQHLVTNMDKKFIISIGKIAFAQNLKNPLFGWQTHSNTCFNISRNASPLHTHLNLHSTRICSHKPKSPMASSAGVKLEDSNLAGIGSDADKDARLAAARTEKSWKGAGQKPGVEVWRVENHKATATSGPRFGVARWPKNQYGHFYNGDSFIVLSTKKDKESSKLHHDIYYWLGSESSQDETGVAAYKTVELDALLGGEPQEHRVCEGRESSTFRALFGKPIVIMSGGVESGFNHVKPHEYKPRLLWVKGTKKLKNIRVQQIAPKASGMNHGDVFILDLGLKLFQFNGRTSGMWEKEKAREVVVSIKSERNGKPSLDVIDDDGRQEEGDFWKAIHGKSEDLAEEGTPDDEIAPRQRAMFRCSDGHSHTKVKFTKVAQGALNKSSLDSSDVRVIDAGIEIFIWVGKHASKAERAQAMPMVEKFMRETKIDKYTPVTKIVEGSRSTPGAFESAFDGTGAGGEVTEFTTAANSCFIVM